MSMFRKRDVIPNVHRGKNGTMTLGVRTLRSLCIDVILVSSKGKKFLAGLQFMYESGMVPDKLSVMMVNDQKYHLQFWIPRVDMHPFTVIFKSLNTLLNGIGHLNVWEIGVLEIMNCSFQSDHNTILSEAIKKLKPKTLMLMNCGFSHLTMSERRDFSDAASNRGDTDVILIGHTFSKKHFSSTRKWANVALEPMSDEIVDESLIPPINGTELAPFPRKFDAALLTELDPEEISATTSTFTKTRRDRKRIRVENQKEDIKLSAPVTRRMRLSSPNQSHSVTATPEPEINIASTSNRKSKSRNHRLFLVPENESDQSEDEMPNSCARTTRYIRKPTGKKLLLNGPQCFKSVPAVDQPMTRSRSKAIHIRMKKYPVPTMSDSDSEMITQF
ncbi:unnamed protein product, partial [Mesorhabditis belari]|uniref:Uncharacterized protein n=1 Tax=Mesorhabditis belari TaxID=2138241 RepID=A0AAF3FQ26_9BILA